MSDEKSPVGGYLEVEPGVEIYYEAHGDGPAVVLVPGWTFTTKVFENQIAALSSSYRVITFDPRSHGRSTVTLEGNNYVTQGADLTKLLTHLGVTKPTLVGWSFGCLTTWEYIKVNGVDAVSAHMAVDLSPTPLTGVEGDWTEGGVTDIAEFYHAIQTSKGHRDLINWYADEVMIEQDYTPELAQWVVDQSTASPPWVATAYLAAGMLSNYMDVAKEIDAAIPSSFVVANHWADTAKAYIAANLPNSKVDAFGGHMMFWEYPEKFNPILADLLAKAK
ncbi:alpha/beta fold hydrolase [Ruegeria arenilitoris]|uniref:alpha/beta fold hydrolase n=1 Tax=Ruegeria arenilitoris TaxID=1173585 RepID=UPI00147A13D2|nr:alpha/beta hydrolase [Ruegeria arenilitoris]